MQAKIKHEIFQRKSPTAAQAKENTQEEKEKNMQSGWHAHISHRDNKQGELPQIANHAPRDSHKESLFKR